jgi:A/G-specific adenine glycosylase
MREFVNLMQPAFFHALLEWYQYHRRQFPWRLQPNLYHTWVCEIMSQQTLLKVVLPKFNEFINCLPQIQNLAAAPEQTLRQLWQGLGYYARARNLQKGAKYIVEKYSDQFPRSYLEWKMVPGVGPYSASILASVHFGERVACVDGNVIRVLSRITELTNPWCSSGSKAVNLTAQQFMDSLPKQFNPGDYNQALMELGATVCSKSSPKCLQCPVRQNCQAFLNKTQTQIPIVKPKKEFCTVNLFLILFQNKNLHQLGILKRTGSFLNQTIGFPILDTRENNFPSLTNFLLRQKDFYLQKVSHSITNHKISAFCIFISLPERSLKINCEIPIQVKQEIFEICDEYKNSLEFHHSTALESLLSSSLDKKILTASKVSHLF